jgi:hypothetical protein
MSVFGVSRFTAMLATIAVLGTVGSFSWAISTRASLKSESYGRSASRTVPVKSAGRALRLKGGRANNFASTVRGEPSRSYVVGWSGDRDVRSEGSVARPTFLDHSNSRAQDGAPDMPLPAPPFAPSDPEHWQAKFSVQPLNVSLPKAEYQRRLVREPKPEPAVAVTPNSPKLTVRSYYIEKIVEQGDAGEVKFRYRRQPCEPPNMPDVCFMPQESRRGIVVERR